MNYTIPKSVVDRLNEYAVKNNISKSYLITKLLDKFLEDEEIRECKRKESQKVIGH